MVAWLLACGVGGEDPVGAALSTSGSGIDDCASAFDEIRTTCLVDVAARAAGQGDEELAEAACAEIAEGLWQHECHFRVGEEHGVRGRIDLALDHCGRAGRFAGSCVTHAAWRMGPVTRVGPGDPGASLELATFTAKVDQALAGAPGVDEAREALLARAWFHLYFGSGSADPGPALGAPEDQGPAARTAFALEVVRLGGDVAEVWAGGELPVGEALPPQRRVGRHAPAVIPRGSEDLARTPTFGGGQRYVGGTVEADLCIAEVAAAYFYGASSDALLALAEGGGSEERATAVAAAVLAAAEPARVAEAHQADPDPLVRSTAHEALVVRRDMDTRKRAGDR